MVKYLVDTYGPDKYAAFFANIKKGGRFDDAMKATYGFDQAGFETEFRGANGLPPLQQQASPTSGAGTSAPTRAATAAGTARPTASVSTPGGGGGVSTTALVIIGVAVLFVLLAVLSYLVSVMLANNRGKGGSGGAEPPAEPPAA
jgi:hypothetical protein